VICQHPLVLDKDRGPATARIVPCGRCAACRINRAEDWTNRMVWESDYFQDSSFVTLTYSEENLPIDRSLDKEELQGFFKRLRKKLHKRRIKYFACGEYGETYGRPHYHAVLFGISALETDLVGTAWGKGQIQLSVFKAARARYCAGYLLKEVDSRVDLRGLVPPFALMSKKMGKRFAVANMARILSGGTLTVNGNPVALPRYFRKILDIDIAKMPSMVEHRMESYANHLERIGGYVDGTTQWAVEDSFQAVREQVALNQDSWESVKEGRGNGL